MIIGAVAVRREDPRGLGGDTGLIEKALKRMAKEPDAVISEQTVPTPDGREAMAT